MQKNYSDADIIEYQRERLKAIYSGLSVVMRAFYNNGHDKMKGAISPEMYTKKDIFIKQMLNHIIIELSEDL